METFLAVTWDPNPEFFRFFGLSIRYYSLMWVIGLFVAYKLVQRFYEHRGYSAEVFDPLFLYCFLGILIGARLGHCLFYEPDYYLTSWKHVIEMFLPIRFMPQGGWKLVGYSGLASHGGTIGIILGMILYCRKYKIKVLECIDMVCLATPFTAACIRIGNLMNSEIVGKPTGTDWGFIFVQNGDNFPRHPAQLYEAIAYLIIFVAILSIYRNNRERVSTGFYFGFCIATIFTFRFFIEFFKEVQVDFEIGLPLDMGQILSIPFIIAGVWLMYRSRRH
ncbi:MAG: prolipoprotein diacylglyceryl transferase [Bacteroidaceae bacterium]|nr:prolipoprotein diacylglyceryl transferase [Bacteroidaceae bacterium]MBP5348425.1 prolipoprotein diacylglyceryl transferase [Bacteroidaceae bacterium]MBR3660175.1 prolipoprotein diacylglyceryl transferase [Bacteroidaceae bacterium]